MWTTVEEHLNWYDVDENGCWVYKGSPSKKYAQCHIGDKHPLLHRVAFEKHKRPLLPGEVPDHLCRNTRCINPANLEAVTHKENVHRGVNLKLTDQQVQEIRLLQGMTHDQIARKYGVSRAHITRILNHSKRP